MYLVLNHSRLRLRPKSLLLAVLLVSHVINETDFVDGVVDTLFFELIHSVPDHVLSPHLVYSCQFTAFDNTLRVREECYKTYDKGSLNTTSQPIP